MYSHFQSSTQRQTWHGLVLTIRHGLVFFALTGTGVRILMGYDYFISDKNSISPSHIISNPIITKWLGCIPDPKIDTWLITLLPRNVTQKISNSPTLFTTLAIFQTMLYNQHRINISPLNSDVKKELWHTGFSCDLRRHWILMEICQRCHLLQLPWSSRSSNKEASGLVWCKWYFNISSRRCMICTKYS